MRAIGFSFSFILVLGVVARPAAALQVNLDFERGEPDPVNFGIPSPGYAAAAPSAGVWNSVNVQEAGNVLPLVDGEGNSTGITVVFDGTGGGRSQDNPSTSGDDQALLDDGFNVLEGLVVVATVTIAGLDEGMYDVYTYAWDPTATASRSTIIDVNGVGAELVVPTSDTFSGFLEGETHAVHRVTLGAGDDVDIAIMNNDDIFDQSTVNGIQVVTANVTPTDLRSWGAVKTRYR